MATSVEKTFSDLVPHLKLLRVITLGNLLRLQYTRDKYPNVSLGDLFTQLTDIVYEVIEDMSFRFEQEKLLTPFIKPLKPLFEQVSALMYPNLNPFREAFIPIFREKMFNRQEFLKELSRIEPILKGIGQSAFTINWPLTEGCATFFKNEKSTFFNIMKSLHQFKKILTVLKRVLEILEIFCAVLESKALKRKSANPLDAMEKQIQEVVTIFNSQFSSIYENCQANCKKNFKSLPLEIDCLVLKVYVGVEYYLIASATNNQQISILFDGAKELGLTSRACKAGEWPCSKLIDF